MKKLTVTLCLGLALSSASWAGKPVVVGGDEEMDACTAIAQLKEGLSKTNFLDEPKEGAKSNGELRKNQTVYVCQENGDWYGIVIPKSEQQECGVSSPIKNQKDYLGPCKSGWIKSSELEITAG